MTGLDGSKPGDLPYPLRGGAGGGGRAAAAPPKDKAAAWEREAGQLSNAPMRAWASSLRRRSTPPEKRLWWHLRHTLGLDGTHFRRQVAVGGYVADFCCLTCRLVLEVDGNQHGTDASLARDATRTRDLEALGFRVLRFSNREVMTSMEVVLGTVLAAASPPPPTPGPSPRGGGESVALEGASR